MKIDTELDYLRLRAQEFAYREHAKDARVALVATNRRTRLEAADAALGDWRARLDADLVRVGAS